MRKMSERATAWPDNELDFQFIFLLIIGQARRRSEEETEKGKRSFGGFARSLALLRARRRTADVTRRARASGGDRAAADNHFGGDVSDGGGEGRRGTEGGREFGPN